MPSELRLVKQVAIPSQSAVATAFKSVNLADAFSIQLPSDASTNPDVLARFIFSVQPSWIGALTNRPGCNRCGIWFEDRHTPRNALE